MRPRWLSPAPKKNVVRVDRAAMAVRVTVRPAIAAVDRVVRLV
jgi:hypothetical protein